MWSQRSRSGTPRARHSATLRRGLRFTIAGGMVGVVYLTTTTVLSNAAGLPFQAALPIGFSTALAVHFLLQRTFVWAHRDGFALPLRHQASRYLAAAAGQYALTVASTSLLPAPLGLPTELVYVVTVGILAASNFLVFRHLIFHTGTAATKGPGGDPRDSEFCLQDRAGARIPDDA